MRLLPGAESFGNVTLRRGMTSNFDLWDWWERVRREPGARATCDIVVLSPDLAQERVRFRLYRCLPAKLTGPRSTRPATTSRSSRWSSPARGSTSSARATSRPARRHEPVAKAQLRELDASFEREINKARWVTVQINPHELRTSFSHELGPTTRLDLRLTFDVDAPRRPEAAARPTTSAA